ncbi:tetratricopeptide repeat protein [Allomuricauda sp. d1]|uniref:SH3 domain-containing protein n=1 Tax=Allomuricauda sp. d1 TaxID=3136725 RepID=UPI0031E0AC0D
MSKKRISIVLVVVFAPILLFAQNEVLFSKATDAYNEGKYVEAIESYQKILRNGEHSAALYFNLGNAHYKLNQIGPSIYYYEKALLLDPNDAEIKNNLGFAKNMRLDAIEQMPKTVMQKLYDNTAAVLSFDGWATTAIVFVILFVALYLAYYLFRYSNYKRIAFISSMTGLALAIVALTFAYLQFQKFKNDNPAIIFSKEVRVLAEPNKRSQEVFTLHEGTKVNIQDTLEDWQKIKIADGQTGWLTSENLKQLKDF